MFEKLRSKLNNTRLTENGSQSLDNTNGGSKTTIKYCNSDGTLVIKFPQVFDGNEYLVRILMKKDGTKLSKTSIRSTERSAIRK